MKIGNLEVYGIIYKIQNKINGKCYIGQTADEKGFNGRYQYYGEGIERIYKTHKNYKNTKKHYNKYLLNSIEKYGFENFSVNKIFDIAFSKEELDIKEDTWIKCFNCINAGYNWKQGGSRGKMSQKSRQLMSNSHKGNKNFMYGKNGDKAPWYGRSHTEEEKRKISEANSGERHWSYGKELSKETKDKLSKKLSGKNNPACRKVICLTTKKIFNYIKEGANFYNINYASNISTCCSGRINYCGKLPDGTKLQWRYISDLTTEEYIKYNVENKLKELELSNQDSSFLLSKNNK